MDERRARIILYAAAASGLLALVVVIAVFSLAGGGSGSKSVAIALKNAGCTFKTYPVLGRMHVNDLAAKVKYNSFPPTSGPHYFQPVVWGSYDKPLVLVQTVHNLEHGGIVIEYGSKVPPAEVAKIGDFYRSDANAMLVAPLPQLGDKIALTAWTHLATCTTFDAGAAKKFRDAFRYKAPEKFPPQFLNPGQ